MYFPVPLIHVTPYHACRGSRFGSQDSSAHRLHSAAHWYFQGHILASGVDCPPPWFPMDAEANRGLEEAFLRRGEREVDGGVYQAGGVSYHANFTLMTQARKTRDLLVLVFLKTPLLYKNALHSRNTPRGFCEGQWGSIDLPRWLMAQDYGGLGVLVSVVLMLLLLLLLSSPLVGVVYTRGGGEGGYTFCAGLTSKVWLSWPRPQAAV